MRVSKPKQTKKAAKVSDTCIFDGKKIISSFNEIAGEEKHTDNYEFKDCPISTFAGIGNLENAKSIKISSSMIRNFRYFDNLKNITCFKIEQSPVNELKYFKEMLAFLVCTISTSLQQIIINDEKIDSSTVSRYRNLKNSKYLMEYLQNGGVVRCNITQHLIDEILYSIKKPENPFPPQILPSNINFIDFVDDSTISSTIDTKFNNDNVFLEQTALNQFNESVQNIYKDLVRNFESLYYQRPPNFVIFLENCANDITLLSSESFPSEDIENRLGPITKIDFIAMLNDLNKDYKDIIINAIQYAHDAREMIDQLNQATSYNLFDNISNIIDLSIQAANDLLNNPDFNVDDVYAQIILFQDLNSIEIPFKTVFLEIQENIKEISLQSPSKELALLLENLQIMKKFPSSSTFLTLYEQLNKISSGEKIVQAAAKCKLLGENYQTIMNIFLLLSKSAEVYKIFDKIGGKFVKSVRKMWKSDMQPVFKKYFDSIKKSDPQITIQKITKCNELSQYIQSASNYLDRTYNNTFTHMEDTAISISKLKIDEEIRILQEQIDEKTKKLKLT